MKAKSPTYAAKEIGFLKLLLGLYYGCVGLVLSCKCLKLPDPAKRNILDMPVYSRQHGQGLFIFRAP